MEPPTVAPRYYEPSYHSHFGKVLIMMDDFVDNHKYFKFYFPQPSLQSGELVPFSMKKLCVLISSQRSSPHRLELYSEREKAIRFFEKNAPKEFDLYGYYWNKKEFPLYKGQLASKKEALRKYKFCICYENMHSVNGYITEKIFDAFKAGCIPVYWGATNITDFVPSSCFIDKRNFRSYADLYKFLKSMSKETYESYLNNIKNFLMSEQAHYFSSEYFVETVFRHLEIK